MARTTLVVTLTLSQPQYSALQDAIMSYRDVLSRRIEAEQAWPGDKSDYRHLVSILNALTNHKGDS